MSESRRTSEDAIRELFPKDVVRTLDEQRTKGDCPHADGPFRYCDGCKASPCPVGLPG